MQDCGNALQEGDVKFISKHSFIAFILFYLRIHTEGLDSTFCITIFVLLKVLREISPLNLMCVFFVSVCPLETSTD